MDENVKTGSYAPDILAALVVLSTVAVYYYGVRALAVLLVSVITCIVTDFICTKAMKQEISEQNLNAVITGLAIGLMMSSAVPYYVVIAADIFAVVVVSYAFGGYNKAIFNAPAAAYLFVSLCFSDVMLTYPKPFDYIGLTGKDISEKAVYSSMAKTIIMTDAPVSTVMDIMIGKFCGAMGTGFTVIMLIAAVFLMIRKTIPAITFFTQFAVAFVYFYIHSGYSITYTAGVISGEMILFGMLFLTYGGGHIPKSGQSEFIYGVLNAALIIIFRMYTQTEYSVVFASVVSTPIVFELNRNTVSLAGILSDKNKGRLKGIMCKVSKTLNHVDETLTLINGSDNIEHDKREERRESDVQ